MADDNKIYVGGLSHDTTSEGLRRHFSQFGELSDCIVMVDKMSGRSRGFGFVTFVENGAMNSAIGTSNVLDGREVFCKKAVRENPAMSSPTQNGMYNTVKIFVGGLPASCDYAKFTEYFGRFGNIEDAVVMMDNQTQRHRGFGYVTFSDSEGVEAALQNYAANQIDGKWIEVKRCIPQDKMAPGQSSKGRGKGERGGKGGGGAPPPFNSSIPPPSPNPYSSGGTGGYDAYSAYGVPQPMYPQQAIGAPYGVAYGGGAYGGYGGGSVPGYPTQMSGGGYERYHYRPAPY